jgi:Fe2+ or Zn2+ uptake regulation protein
VNQKLERSTRQKELIFHVLQSAARPLTVQEVYHLASQFQAGLGSATVYRSIHRLLESGKIRSLSIPMVGTCYELADEPAHHSHFLCTQCHRVFELAQELAPSGPQVLPGFVVDKIEVLVQGSCGKCNQEA